MSGRIYDLGVNPICDKCGSKMWSSTDNNFNGCTCKRKGCNGNPIYEPFNSDKTKITKINGEYVLEGVFSDFKHKKRKYSIFERLRNFLYTMLND